MANSRRGILGLNAVAVDRICHGELQEAAQLLGRALRRLKERVLDDDRDRSAPEEHQGASDQHDSEHYYTVRSHLVDYDEGNNSSVFSMYNRALIVDAADTDAALSPRNEATLSGVLLFNMALCHHLLGHREPDGHRRFQRALKIYEAAAAIVSLNRGLRGTDHLLFLAIYNNKAHIFATLYCEEEAQQCLSWLREGLGALPPAAGGGGDDADGDEADGDADDGARARQDRLCHDDLADIHLNLALFPRSKAHAAAA